MTADKINEILGIKESYKMPETLLKLLLSNYKNNLLNKFVEVGENLENDWFNEYYQTEHSDRNKLKQDFTPVCLCEIVSQLTEQKGTIGDICSGTGSLSIRQWVNGADNFFCLEYSERAIPVLLFNLAVRNVNATVINGDALTKEVFTCYKLTKTDKYSNIEIIKEIPEVDIDTIVSNPPYSFKWNGDRSFGDYAIPPKSKGDYAFILDSLERLNNGGTLIEILPHGVLFRGATEEKIRKKLIENNLIDAVIGLPDKLFLNTGIPVFIMILKKNRDRKDILFIDASKDFERNGSNSIMTKEHINKLINAVKERKFIDKYANVCDVKEIEENDYNLNIPRYVDTFEPEVLPYTLEDTAKEILELEKEIYKNTVELFNAMKQLTAKTPEKRKELKVVTDTFGEMVQFGKQKYEQLSFKINT